MTEAHKAIAEMLSARDETALTVWEMGRADRLLTLGQTPRSVAEKIIQARAA